MVAPGVAEQNRIEEQKKGDECQVADVFFNGGYRRLVEQAAAGGD
jgi:hypothetical protein